MLNKTKLYTTILALIITSASYAEKNNIKAMYETQKYTPGIVFNGGRIFDRSFNQMIYDAAQNHEKKTGIKFDYLIDKQEDKIYPRQLLAHRGADPVIMAGFGNAAALKIAANNYPKSYFYIIDDVIDLPNVHSIIFKEHEGSFLAGALAAMKSKTNVIGFVGGMDIGVIHKFECGYKQGAEYVNPKIKLISNVIGEDNGNIPWNNPRKAKLIAEEQINNKVDIIFPAAGDSGEGVFHAAKQNGIYAIGVDANQNYLVPGTILTSVVKHVDVAVGKSIKERANGFFTSGVEVLGLAEDGVDISIDKYNRSLITVEDENRINEIKSKIISGEIKVHDFTVDNNCP